MIARKNYIKPKFIKYQTKIAEMVKKHKDTFDKNMNPVMYTLLFKDKTQCNLRGIEYDYKNIVIHGLKRDVFDVFLFKL